MKDGIFLFVLFMILFSCKKDDQDEPDKGCVVTQYVYDTGENEKYTYANNQIEDVAYIDQDGNKTSFRFYYNNSGQIIKLEFLENGTDLFHYREYSFDVYGNMIRDEQYSKDGNEFSRQLIFEYVYNDLGKIQAIYKYDDNGTGINLSDYDTVIYEGGNPVRKIDYDISNGIPANQTAISEFEFDNKINFLTIMKEPYFFHSNYLGDNNITRETRKVPGGSVFYEMIWKYEYNEYGYVTRLKQINVNASDTSVTDVVYLCD